MQRPKGGQSLGNPSAAGLIRASRPFGGGRHTVCAIYDYWDPNTGAANNRPLGPNVGYIYQMSPDAKITLEFTGRRNEATAGTVGGPMRGHGGRRGFASRHPGPRCESPR